MCYKSTLGMFFGFKFQFKEFPLAIFLIFISIAFFGVYFIAAHPADQGSPVMIGGSPEQNPYYYIGGELPDLDNCPGGPNAQPCYDEFGVAIPCYNPSQDDGDFDLVGDICDPDTQIAPPPPTPTATDSPGRFCSVRPARANCRDCSTAPAHCGNGVDRISDGTSCGFGCRGA